MPTSNISTHYHSHTQSPTHLLSYKHTNKVRFVYKTFTNLQTSVKSVQFKKPISWNQKYAASKGRRSEITDQQRKSRWWVLLSSRWPIQKHTQKGSNKKYTDTATHKHSQNGHHSRTFKYLNYERGYRNICIFSKNTAAFENLKKTERETNKRTRIQILGMKRPGCGQKGMTELNSNSTTHLKVVKGFKMLSLAIQWKCKFQSKPPFMDASVVLYSPVSASILSSIGLTAILWPLPGEDNRTCNSDSSHCWFTSQWLSINIK